MAQFCASELNWQKGDGLLPCVVQCWQTQKVLMVGFMNEAALQVTQESGMVTFFSRTRSRLWMKGETSGSFLQVKNIAVDCDGDTLLIRAQALGPTCHTGAVSCFSDSPATNWAIELVELWHTIEERADSGIESGSYTKKLLNGDIARVAQKVGEEGVEVALAAVTGEGGQIAEEAADLCYHLFVLLKKSGISPSDVAKVLQSRRRKVADCDVVVEPLN